MQTQKIREDLIARLSAQDEIDYVMQSIKNRKWIIAVSTILQEAHIYYWDNYAKLEDRIQKEVPWRFLRRFNLKTRT